MPNEKMSTPEGYYVVLFNLPDDPHAVRDMLVEHLGLHPSDAQIAARSAPGVLPYRFDKARADVLVKSAADLGVSARVLAESNVPDFRDAETVRHPRSLDAGLELLDYRGEATTVIPWSDLRVLSIGYIPVDHSNDFRVEASGSSDVAPHLRHPPTDAALYTGLEAWLVRSNPVEGYRINYNMMNYETLGERKTPSATQNFRLFVEELIQRSPHLYLTPATRAFLEHGLLRHYEFHTVDELRRHTEFHTLLSQQTPRQD